MLDFQTNYGYTVDKSFKDPVTLISQARKKISGNLEDICNGRRINMGYDNYVYVKLDRVCEKGVVYQIVCQIDAASSKYDTGTSGLLIVRNDGTVKLILNKVDARVNLVESDTYMADVNQEIISQELRELGTEIKTEPEVRLHGLFAKKREDLVKQKNDLIRQKEQILVKASLDNLSKALLDYNEKENGAKSK